MRLVVGLLLVCLGVVASVRVETRLLPVAMPHALVGTWAWVCGSVAGELFYGVTISPDGRVAANDGTKVCWIETIRRDDQALAPDRVAGWRVTGTCGDVARQFEGTMTLQRLGGDVVLQRIDKACSDACVNFPLKHC